MAKDDHEHDETKPGPAAVAARPRVAVPAEHGEFTHQAEEAESPCVTGRPAPRCGCGLYELEWAAPEAP